MTILGAEYQEVSIGKFRTVHKFKCDQCGTVYEKEEKKSRREKPTHFCSLLCANKAQLRNGPLDDVRKAGFRKRLGVDYPQQSSAVQERSRRSCVQKYGVENVQQVPEIKRRTHITYLNRLEKRQRELGVWTSKVENTFAAVLVEKFGELDVQRQKRVNRWPIDFYIVSLDTYVQFDGVYWHGLDRSPSVIAECKNAHDQEIWERRNRDAEQNEWFDDHKMKLVRITDREFKDMNIDVLLSRIELATCKNQSA